MRTLFRKLATSVCATFTLMVLSFPLLTRAESVIPTDFQFTKTLKQGSRGEEVRYLQVLLNLDAETRVNSKGRGGGAGNETDFLGGSTVQAIIKFQNKYKAEVLRPANLRTGNGTVGKLTRAKLNSLLNSARREAIRARSEPVVTHVTHSPETITPVATTTPVFSSEELNLKARRALVNILCTTKRGGLFSPISGSGVFIDPRGVILTNAHVGQ